MFDDAGSGAGASTSGMQANPEDLASAANQANATADALDTMLRNLMQRIEPPMTRWLGAAGYSFRTVQDEFNIEMGKLNGALRSIGDDVGVSSSNYSVADDEMATALTNAGAEQGTITYLLSGLER
jgi:WXG100 family type VII secretion target